MSSHPIRVNALRGHVKQGIYAKGSKSERNAVFIETADTTYILRYKTGPVYDDPELVKYIGHYVQCEGFLVKNTLLAERIKMVN